jgi:hypothetical protein
MLSLQNIEQIRTLFNPKPERGSVLPDVRSVQEYTEYLLLQSNNVYHRYKMIAGHWHQEKVDANDKVYLERI